MGNAVLAVDGKLQPDAPESAATLLRTFPRGAYTAFAAQQDNLQACSIAMWLYSPCSAAR